METPAADQPSDVTRILTDAVGGDQDAANRLMPLVYDELRILAAKALRRERRDHTLQPTKGSSMGTSMALRKAPVAK